MPALKASTWAVPSPVAHASAFTTPASLSFGTSTVFSERVFTQAGTERRVTAYDWHTVS